MDYYSVLKNVGLLSYALTGLNLKGQMFSTTSHQRRKAQHTQKVGEGWLPVKTRSYWPMELEFQLFRRKVSSILLCGYSYIANNITLYS